MAYRIKRSDRTVQAALRRIALEEIDAGLAEIDDPAMDLDDKVHQLRKRAKRLRGLIRLVRPAFPDFATENAAIRDAARRLSGLRDKAGMIETHDKLAAATGAGDLAPVRAYLVALRDAAAAESHVAEDLAEFRRALVDLGARARHWRLKEKGFAGLRPGLEKTFSRARRGRAAAARTADVPTIHDWRKRVKYHWYHTRLLAPLRPGPLARRGEQLRELSEILGDHHDLSVLDAAIAGASDLPGEPALWAAYRARIAGRLRVLEDEAQALGTRLFASPGHDLGRRWKNWWKDWRPA